MNRIAPLLLMCLIAVVQLYVLAFTTPGRAENTAFGYLLPDKDANSWRELKCCGPNSLYCMLRLNDVDVTLDQVLQAAPPGERGVSLVSLENASNQLGFRTTTVFVETPGALPSLPFPMIAHMSAARDGHFVVLLGIDEANGEVIIGDAVSCEVKRQKLTEFAHLWSGYLLVHDTVVVGWWFDRVLITGCGLCLVVFIAWRLSSVATATRNR